MAYSNMTEFLELPQFAGSDHPTFTGDFNEAFQAIDTSAKQSSQSLQLLESKTNTLESYADSLNTSIEELTSISSSLSSSLNSLDQKNTITQDALNTITNTVSTFENDIQTALSTSNEALDQAQISFSNSSSQGNRVTKLEQDLETITTTANTAKSTANTAKSTADAAKSTADSVQSALTTLQNKVNGITSFTESAFKTMVLNVLFPVGSIYITIANINPGTTIGGTWSRVTSGYFLQSTGSTSTVGTTGGSNSKSFTLTVDNSPWQGSGGEVTGYGLTTGGGFTNRVAINRSGDKAKTAVTLDVQPKYFNAFIWKRTA